MAASYPSSAKTFAAITDGDNILASHQTEVRDEITAIETELVTSGLTNPLKVNDGIQFPATQVSSSDVNRLDDYEEGTFSPTMSAASGSGPSYTLQQGRYVKVGRVVHIYLRIILSSLGTLSGNVSIDGLPFTAETLAGTRAGALSCPYFADLGANFVMVGGYITNGTSAVTVVGLKAAAAGVSQLTASDVSADGDIVLTGWYPASA